MVEAALITLILGDADLASALGGRVQSATEPLAAGTATRLPRATYQRISTRRQQSNDGPIGLAHARLDVNVWASKPIEAATIAGRLRRLLDGFAGAVATPGGRTIDVRQVAVVDEQAGAGDAAGGSQSPTQRVRLELLVAYAE